MAHVGDLVFQLIRNGIVDKVRHPNVTHYFQLSIKPADVWIPFQNFSVAMKYDRNSLYRVLVLGYVAPVKDIFPLKGVVRLLPKHQVQEGEATVPFGRIFTLTGLLPQGINIPLQSNLASEMYEYVTLEPPQYPRSFALQIAGETHEYVATFEAYIRLFGALVKYGDWRELVEATASPRELAHNIPIFRRSNYQNNWLSLPHYIQYQGAPWLKWLAKVGLYKYVSWML